MRSSALAGVVVVVVVGLLGVGLRSIGSLGPVASSSPQSVQAADDVQGHWVSVGPSPATRNSFYRPTNPKAPGSGRIGSIAVNPTNLAHWLLGVGNGGVWESWDAGGSWVPLTDAAPTLATGDVTFDPTNPQTIYVGTGEAHGGGMAMGGVGILKSTDGGQTWAVVGAASFARGSVRRLRVNPDKPSELVAASTRGGFGRQAQDFPQSPPPYGVLKSSDAGQTWVRTLSGQATALEIDPANFNRQYAAIGENRLDLPTDLNRVGTDVVANGLYRSTDAGQHWDSIAGPWGASSSTQLVTGRIELALAPSNPNVLYASLSQPDGNRILGLYRTDNAWADVPTWRQISIAQTSVDINNFSPGTYCSNCNYAHVISVNPSDPDMLFAGGKVQLWRCTNCGSTAPQWKLANTTSTDTWADQHAIAWAGNRLILGNDGGVFSTIDLGATWQNHNASITTIMFYNGALHPTDPGFMIGGSRDHGFTIRRGGSFVWDDPISDAVGGGEGEVALSFRHPETDWMAANFSGNGIFRTIDGFTTATRVDAAIDKTGGAAFIFPVRKCPSNDDVFVTGTTRLWRTDNFFNSSLPSWSPNGPSGTGATGGLIYAITFAASDTNCDTYAYGTSRSEIRLTRDGGRTWVDLNPNTAVPVLGINSIAFAPTNSDTIYLAVSAFNTQDRVISRHVYKTTNASATPPTWVNISPDEDVPFNVIVVDPRNSSLVYAGGDTGLWVSGDAGATWQKVGPDRGLPHAAVYDIKINPATNQTVVFTHGRGAFQLVTS